MYFKQDARNIIKKVYESDTEDPLGDCDEKLHARFDNEEYKVIFIQEYLEDLSPLIVAQHFDYLLAQGVNSDNVLVYPLQDYNVFNIVALVKRNK